MATKKFQNTAPRNSSEELSLLKLDQLIEQLQALATKLDGDTGVTDTDYGDLVNLIKLTAEELRTPVPNTLDL